MTIGRLSLHRSEVRNWEISRGICNCLIVEAGPLTLTWHDRRCTCSDCGHYVCRCK